MKRPHGSPRIRFHRPWHAGIMVCHHQRRRRRRRRLLLLRLKRPTLLGSRMGHGRRNQNSRRRLNGMIGHLEDFGQIGCLFEGNFENGAPQNVVHRSTKLNPRLHFRLDLFGRPWIHDILFEFFFFFLIKDLFVRFVFFVVIIIIMFRRRRSGWWSSRGGRRRFLGNDHLSGSLFLDSLGSGRRTKKAIDGISSQNQSCPPQDFIFPINLGQILFLIGRIKGNARNMNHGSSRGMMPRCGISLLGSCCCG